MSTVIKRFNNRIDQYKVCHEQRQNRSIFLTIWSNLFEQPYNTKGHACKFNFSDASFLSPNFPILLHSHTVDIVAFYYCILSLSHSHTVFKYTNKCIPSPYYFLDDVQYTQNVYGCKTACKRCLIFRTATNKTERDETIRICAFTRACAPIRGGCPTCMIAPSTNK